jgi:hypothetical protein
LYFRRSGRDCRTRPPLGRSTDRTKTKGSASDSKPSAINTWPPSGASAGSHDAFGREAAIRATPEAKLRFPPTSVSQGWVRFVRFQEVERTQQMADMGAKPPILCPRAYVRCAPKPDLDGPDSKVREGPRPGGPPPMSQQGGKRAFRLPPSLPADYSNALW